MILLHSQPVLALALLGASLLLPLPSWTADRDTSKVIIVGGDYNYPPYEFIDKEGRPAGYNVELTQAIAEVMGMEVEIRLGIWTDMRHALENGEIDALQGMVYSKERSQFFDFSPPHAIIHQSIFARRGETMAASLEALRDKEVIVQQSGIMHDYLMTLDVGAKLILVDTHARALRLLASGKHDYALVANLPGLYLEQELKLSNLITIAKPFSGQRYGYAVRKGDADLLSRLSEGLAILKNTGRQELIYDQWLGVLEKRGIPWEKVGLLGAILSGSLAVVLGGIMIWNRALQKKVEERTEELRVRQQQLIQADKMTSLGILVSGVAHEINNPSSLLLLNLPVMMEAYEDSREILEAHYQQHGDFPLGGLEYSRMRGEIPLMLSEMLDGAKRIKRTVEDLKDFARQGHAHLGEIIDLNTVVATAIRLVDNSIHKSSNHFEVHYGPDLPNIKGNAQRIEQVVINLILNACQALDNPEQAITVSTRYDADKGIVALEVRDAGKGIDAEHLPRLTDPFFTTKRELGGTGLGLSVSAGIAQEHGGSLQFDSTPGKGTTVTLSLPVVRREKSR